VAAVAAQLLKDVDQQPEVVVAADAALPLLKVAAARVADVVAQHLKARRLAADAVAHLRPRPLRRRSLLTVFISSLADIAALRLK